MRIPRHIVAKTLMVVTLLPIVIIVASDTRPLLGALIGPEALADPSSLPSSQPLRTSVPATPPSVSRCGVSLQERIDHAVPGSVLDLSGCAYAESVTISRPMTLLGPTIEPPSGAFGIQVDADAVIIEKVRVVGHGDVQFDGEENGIVVAASADDPVRQLTIRNCEVASLGGHGMLLTHVADLTVTGNSVHDIVYAGIKVNSGIGGRITDNTIARIGLHDAAANSNNAYGIDLERIVARDLVTNPRTRDFIVADNVVTDVPAWHGIDTHAGESIVFSGNRVERSFRSLFITTDSVGTRPTDIVVSDNDLIYAGDTASVAISVYSGNRVTIISNHVDSWPADARYRIDPSSTQVTVSANVRTP